MSILKNIIIVCDFAYIEGGASRVAHESAIALAENPDYNVTVFTAVGPVSNELEQSKAEVICLDQEDILNNKNRVSAFLQGLWNARAKQELTKVLNKCSPENTVVHIHTWTKGLSSSIFPVTEKLGFQVALTIHDYFLVCPNGGLYNYKKHRICEIDPLSIKCICANCDSRCYAHKLFRLVRQIIQNRNIRKRQNITYLFISDFSKAQILKRKLEMRRVAFVTNPINFGTRYRVDCKNNDVYLFVGRLTDEKGIRVFCEGVTHAGVKGRVIGAGILEEELRVRYPNIEFVGWLEKKDMEPHIRQTRCFIFPSTWYEVAPLIPLEMMAYGIPCIISDKNSAQAYVEDGVTGVFYDGNDPDSLKNKIDICNKNDIVSTLSCNIIGLFDNDNYSIERHKAELVRLYAKALI